ncbi:MAG: MFS transporter [Actinobacteria bacterium]|nr:MFS transporter [Actinomycetota bacterium]
MSEPQRLAAPLFYAGTALATVGSAVGVLEATYIATTSDPSRGALRTATMITLLLVASVLTVPHVPGWAARWGYRRLYVVADSGAALVWGALSLALFAGLPPYPALLAAVPVMGVMSAMSAVLAPLLCRAYLSGHSMAGAYARLSVIMGLSWAAGSLLGGYLLLSVPPGVGIFARGLLVIPLVVVLATVAPRGAFPKGQQRGGRAYSTLLQHVRTPGPLRATVAVTCTLSVFALPFLSLIVPITSDLREVPLLPGAGLLMAGSAVGEVFAPLLVTLLQRRLRSLPAAAICGLACAGCLLAFALASFIWTGQRELAAWILVGLGFGAARFTAKALQIDAAVTSGAPDGEAVATLSFVKGVCDPIGLLLWALLMTFVSVEAALLVACVGLSIGSVAVWISCARRGLTRGGVSGGVIP